MNKGKDTSVNKELSGGSQDRNAGADGKPRMRISIRIKFSLSIIALVFIIVVTITAFFLWRESGILKEQIFSLMERETIHLSNIARDSIGVDDLALEAAVKDLDDEKKFPHIKYVYILDKNSVVQRSFDKRSQQKAEVLKDNVKRPIEGKADTKTVAIVDYPDPNETRGVIYDFSKLVPSPINPVQTIGRVIIGLSDKGIRDEVATITKWILLISLIFLGISVVGSIILTSVIIKPIRELSHGAAVIGQGNLDYKINIKSTDELGQLAREFNIMTAMIKQAKDKEIESRLMEEQLEMARDIQEGLNPMGFYENHGIQIKGYTKAAKGVGGDYFDYIDIDGNRIGALISDVSGKGVPASLVMVMIRTVFTTYIARKDVDCARVVRAINDALSADFAIDKFATLFFMIYDRKNQELSFANAGHGPLFCYRSAKRACTLTKVDGTPIGIMEDVDYKQAKVKLSPGDIVIMYTDGVTEMRNEGKEEYGLKRLQGLLMKNSGMNAKELVDYIVTDVETFRGNANPHDDMTVLVFKRIS